MLCDFFLQNFQNVIDSVGTMKYNLQSGVIIIDNVNMARDSSILTVLIKKSLSSKKIPAYLTANILY
jgi:hypothetical protein